MLALSKIYDPLVIRIAAVLAIILSFSPKFEAVINTIPTGIIGGISFVLYGMISAIGVRNVVENRVDFTNSRNLIVAAVILVCALGFNSVAALALPLAASPSTCPVWLWLLSQAFCSMPSCPAMTTSLTLPPVLMLLPAATCRSDPRECVQFSIRKFGHPARF